MMIAFICPVLICKRGMEIVRRGDDQKVFFRCPIHGEKDPRKKEVEMKFCTVEEKFPKGSVVYNYSLPFTPPSE